VQNHHGTGPYLCFDTQAVVSLVLVHDRTDEEDDLAPARRIPAGRRILRVHVLGRNSRKFLGEIDVDPICVELRREARVFGPKAEIATGIGSLILINPVAGFRKPTLRVLPSIRISGVSPRNMAVTAPM